MEARKTYRYFQREYEKGLRYDGESKKRWLLDMMKQMEETYGLWLEMGLDEEGEAAGRLYRELQEQI